MPHHLCCWQSPTLIFLDGVDQGGSLYAGAKLWSCSWCRHSLDFHFQWGCHFHFLWHCHFRFLWGCLFHFKLCCHFHFLCYWLRCASFSCKKDKSRAGVRTRLARSIWSWRDPAPSKSFTGFSFSCLFSLYKSNFSNHPTIHDISVFSFGIQPNTGDLLLV